MQITQQNTSPCISTRMLAVIVFIQTSNHRSDERAIGAGRSLSVALLWAILQHPGNEPGKRQKKEAGTLNFVGTEI
jgi:hypothetical protein